MSSSEQHEAKQESTTSAGASRNQDSVRNPFEAIERRIRELAGRIPTESFTDDFTKSSASKERHTGEKPQPATPELPEIEV